VLVQEISARFSVNLSSQGFFKYLNLELLQSNLLGLVILNLLRLFILNLLGLFILNLLGLFILNLLGLFILNLGLDGTAKPCGDQQRAPSWDPDLFSSECFYALGD
jgi:hypothetical protein